MTDATAIVWQLAEEIETVPTTLATIPETVREYLRAWTATIDHGCGHSASVYFTAMPRRSVVCPDCARRVGLDRLASTPCGICGSALGNDGTCTVFALNDTVIIFAAFCAQCIANTEPLPARSNRKETP